MKTFRTPMIAALLFAASAPAIGAEMRVSVGDHVNGRKLYAKECAACHGEDGRGGRSGRALTDSGRLNLIPNDTMYALISEGGGLKKPKEHRFAAKLGMLDVWDVVSHVRTLHLTLDQFFPEASRYVSKVYTIDAHGLERIEKVTGKPLGDKAAAVFTFYAFDGEEGRLAYVPPDPIKLDQLKKDKKLGYLVFLPLKTEGFEGEIGIGMDRDGEMTGAAVHASVKGAEAFNRSLARFKGMGKKGQKDPFRQGKAIDRLADDLFPVYLRAMETVTMYDREEAERTWADE